MTTKKANPMKDITYGHEITEESIPAKLKREDKRCCAMLSKPHITEFRNQCSNNGKHRHKGSAYCGIHWNQVGGEIMKDKTNEEAEIKAKELEVRENIARVEKE